MRIRDLFFTLAINCFIGNLFGQDTCTFAVVDTLRDKKAFYVVDEDTTLNKNTKYHYTSYFLTSKEDFETISVSKVMDNSYYVPPQGLTTQLIVNKDKVDITKYEELEDVGQHIIIKKEKTKGPFTLYSVFSPLGFVHWKLSKDEFNQSRSIEQLKYTGANQCVFLYSPVKYIKKKE